MKTVLAVVCMLFTTIASALDVNGHWWTPTEPGWGVAVQQQRDTIFVQLYTYDANGAPLWYVASCQLKDGLCPATLYKATGGAALPFYTKPTLDAAGVATFNFTSDVAGIFSFKIGDGIAWPKDVVKMVF